MKKNLGNGDRIVRIIIGVILVSLAFFVDHGILKLVLVGVGVFSFYEAFASWCVFYMLIGRNTCPLQ